MAEALTPPDAGGEHPGRDIDPAGGHELERVGQELGPRPSASCSTTSRTGTARPKFRLAFAALAGLGLAAIAAAAIFLVAGRPPKPPAWSSGSPRPGATTR